MKELGFKSCYATLLIACAIVWHILAYLKSTNMTHSITTHSAEDYIVDFQEICFRLKSSNCNGGKGNP